PWRRLGAAGRGLVQSGFSERVLRRPPPMSRIDAAGTVTVPETGHGCLVFRGSQLLLTDAGDVANDCLAFVRHAAPLRILPLGEHRGRPCVVAEVARECEAPPGHAFRHLRGLLDMLPRVSL